MGGRKRRRGDERCESSGSHLLQACEIKTGTAFAVPFFTESQIGGDEENRTPVRNRLGRDNLRVQSAVKKFPLRMSPLTG